MATCLDKLLKRTRQPVPEKILGKIAVAVSPWNCLHDILSVTWCRWKLCTHRICMSLRWASYISCFISIILDFLMRKHPNKDIGGCEDSWILLPLPGSKPTTLYTLDFFSPRQKSNHGFWRQAGNGLLRFRFIIRSRVEEIQCSKYDQPVLQFACKSLNVGLNEVSTCTVIIFFSFNSFPQTVNALHYLKERHGVIHRGTTTSCFLFMLMFVCLVLRDDNTAGFCLQLIWDYIIE